MTFIAALALAATASVAGAQSRWSVEGRVGGALSVETLGDADLDPGLGFEGNVRFRVLPHLSLYGGWDWQHFMTDELVSGTELHVEETGYAYGLRFDHPLRGRVAFWLRGGGTYNHIKIENDDGDIIEDTGHGAGWEFGGGVAVRMAERWQLTPGVRLRSLTRDLELGGTPRSVTLRYVTVGIGFVRQF